MEYLLIGIIILSISLTLILPLIPDFILKKDEFVEEKKPKSKEDSFDFKVNQFFLNINEDEEKEIVYVNTQKELTGKARLPLKLQFKIYLNKLFNTPFASTTFINIVVTILIMIGISFGISITITSPLLFIPMAILLSMSPIIFFIYKTYNNEIKIMESNFFLCTAHYNKYVSSSTFLDSLRVTRNSFVSTSREYDILDKVYKSIVMNNLPIDLTVEYWGKLMIADSTIMNYLQTIIKCEMYLPEYKGALPLILDRSRDIRMLKQKQLEHYSYFLLLSNFSIAVSIFILYYLRWFSGEESGVQVFRTVLGNSMVLICYMIMVLCVLFVLITNKPVTIDPTGMPDKIEKRTVNN